MNKQGKIVNGKVIGGIEWTKTIHSDGTESPGYTWNPVRGCFHRCRWEMPDGDIAICYAEEVALNVAQSAYPNGFEYHQWNPHVLNEPSKVQQPAKIFLDSMSDLMGHWVPENEIEAVLQVCRDTPHHTYQLLTKNAPRLLKFNFPDNVWVGVSAPPTQMMGKSLTRVQQQMFLTRSLNILDQVKAKVRWMSIEPLSFDIGSDLMGWYKANKWTKPLPLEWAVIGAATHGRKVYQPEPEWVYSALNAVKYSSLGDKFPVFYKGNLRGNLAADPWREEFPE